MREFPTSEHNDAPDAVQGALRQRITTTPKQRERDERRRRAREEWYGEYGRPVVRL